MELFFRKLVFQLFYKKQLEQCCLDAENKESSEGLQSLKSLLSNKGVDRYYLGYCLTKGLYKDKKKYNPYWKSFLKLTDSIGGHGAQQSEYSPIYTLIFLKNDAYEVCFIVNKRSFYKKTIRLELEVSQKVSGHTILGTPFTHLETEKENTTRYALKFKNKNWKQPTISFTVALTDSATLVVSNRQGASNEVIFRDCFHLKDFGK